MKKYMLVSLLIAFLLVTVGGPCLAGTVANTSKKGSLLIFPLIRTDTTVYPNFGTESWETLITIGNDNYYSVNVCCVFVLKDACDRVEQCFILTPNQPITFKASDGTDLDGDNVLDSGIDFGNVAEAKCWVTSQEDSGATTQNVI